eukprot:TRINITY_DN5095_c0_g1_i1.p1 TRINITY_DN5095_c0_g1~~TRINITY_DN5095_c0_g1_i1.p1  ORF type:complete len:148 (+),score=10.45 TRINITY_DN5095_c0_g1_i1:537-980(+)
MCKANQITLLMSGLNSKLMKGIETHVMIDPQNFFDDYDHAIEYVEEQLLMYAEYIRSKWLILPSMKKLNALSSIKEVKGPFSKLLSRDCSIWNYCRPERYEKDYVLSHAGNVSKELVILQSGKVSFYLNNPKTVKSVSVALRVVPFS